MKNCGLDLGKKYSHFCVLGERRERLAEGRVRTRVADLEALFGGQERMRIVVEASTKAFFVADVLTELGHEVHVVDPGKTKAIGATQIKHDKLDARVLALLSHVDLLAEVDRPS
ncbi:MAG: transposase, partial [Myxococcales bacterium]|nr:transposase [Myxococcales bacterium]